MVDGGSDDSETTDGASDGGTDEPGYDVNVREHPEAYEVGRGEQGAFEFQPYKDELLPLWGIKTLDEAETAAEEIFERFRVYEDEDDFVGMDMARKYLQMGWTRSLRYAKYPGGRKYDDDGSEREPQQWYDEEKYAISQIYRDYLDRVEANDEYTDRRTAWRERHG
jgi:hypothetical protein